MLFSEDTLKLISNIFCGNNENLYAYKPGPQLVTFFNEFLQKKDIYQSGFPSRWIYVYNNLSEIINKNQIDKFFTYILSKEYLIKDLKCDEVTAFQKSNEILKIFNDSLKFDSYTLLKKENQYFLFEENNDLVLIGSGGFANVYRQKSSGKILKKLKEDFITDKAIRSRFKREYNLTKNLNDIQ